VSFRFIWLTTLPRGSLKGVPIAGRCNESHADDVTHTSNFQMSMLLATMMIQAKSVGEGGYYDHSVEGFSCE
jgi:hypothetical protein